MRLVAAARRPLIWAGGGALRADAGDAVARACREAVRAGHDHVHEPGPGVARYPWVARDRFTPPRWARLWDEADLVIGIGTDFDGVMTQNWLMPQPPRLICVNVDPADASKNYAADVTLVGDAREVTLQLAAAVAARDHGEVDAGALEQVRAGVAAAVLADDADAAGFLAAMDRALPRRGRRGGRHVHPGLLAAPATAGYPGRARSPIRSGWGTLGFAFPPHWAPLSPMPGRPYACAATAASSSPAANWRPSRRRRSRSRWSSSTTAATECCA